MHPPSQYVPFQSVLRENVLDWLKAHVPEPRIRHILRVEQMAIALAQTHQLCTETAAQAALMHDLAKFFPPDRLLKMAQDEGIPLNEVDEADPHLLHADIGAIVARDEFGVTDEEILAAIRNHTLGQPGMSALSCVVFLADTLEPGRGNTDALNDLRQISSRNLAEAVWHTSDYTLKYLMESKRLIHPRTVATRNWFFQQSQSPRSSRPTPSPQADVPHWAMPTVTMFQSLQ
ncbi:bis(5'-nucleosyl)-tetraphosphatase (symmetrical) YqeK [Alkalinema sp. FACHB-956]|uniref:bis(5'-nucleosyl)-tetraphosphatase (symmetrical) YqeK n=1 Tax=Alkalinema sp. FACHB-956 TaxID=2692768 RepID=UPI001F55A9FF|nr:bis(5'-nucleosyl)-tetraphosphatase (symmetrical) YqeK [Alkalinema sp. FACHB-956]